jgi:hypothetical protein
MTSRARARLRNECSFKHSSRNLALKLTDRGTTAENEHCNFQGAGGIAAVRHTLFAVEQPLTTEEQSMRCALTLAACAVLAACIAPQRLATFGATCSSVAFDQYGRCIESSIETSYPTWRNDSHGDLVQTYIARLNAAGARVKAGAMDEYEAWLGAATLKTRLVEIAHISTSQRFITHALTSRMRCDTWRAIAT